MHYCMTFKFIKFKINTGYHLHVYNTMPLFQSAELETKYQCHLHDEWLDNSSEFRVNDMIRSFFNFFKWVLAQTIFQIAFTILFPLNQSSQLQARAAFYYDLEIMFIAVVLFIGACRAEQKLWFVINYNAYLLYT